MPTYTELKCPDVVEQTIQQWIRNLTESSSKNKLLYARNQSRGTIELNHYNHQALRCLLASQWVALTDLSPFLKASDVEECLDTIRQRASKAKEEQGLNTLFLGLGIASWAVENDRKPPSAPVFLVPVTINAQNKLQRTGEIQINLALLQELESKLQRPLRGDVLFADFEGKISPELIHRMFQDLLLNTDSVPGLTIELHAVLSNFYFHKMAIVEDLKVRRDTLSDNPVIKILTGTSQQTTSSPDESYEPPSNLEELLVFQADSSQKAAIRSVLRNEPLTLIQGPPGTGKSQTIANLIAVLAAKGQRVLFVAQKQSALEAVQRKLQDVGLGHLLLDLHHVTSRHQVIQQFAESWKLVQQTPPSQPDEIQKQLTKKAASLARLTQRIHYRQAPTGTSIYQMMAELLHTSNDQLESDLEAALQHSEPSFWDIPADPALKEVDWNAVEHEVQAFRQLTKQQRQKAVGRICDAYAQNVILTMDREQEQETRVKQEMQKQRHRPLRPFLSNTFEVVSRLHPCWMMSPLSVSQNLDTNCQFDVVIFDEASQIRVEEALPAILRSSQTVVVGDQQQLPPSTCYTSNPQNSKSLLESLADYSLASHCLRWHYRSYDDRLIAFANRNFYHNCLITFPSAFKNSPICHIEVGQVSNQSGEAFYQEMLTQLIKHFKEALRPDGCLLITSNTEQARLLRRVLASYFPTINGYSSKKFRVKNLQNVQGDEADTAIWILNPRKNRSGELQHTFGQLLSEGGEKSLNVATTRPRRLMLLVSTFSSNDLKPEKCKHPQALQLLKEYMSDHVADEQEQGNHWAPNVSQAKIDRFEADIFHALTAWGLQLQPLLGASWAKIRFAVTHPYRPDRLVLAIETDGPHYQRIPDVQDRYLLWPEQLEKRGFQVHRIWAVDWFLNRDTAIARVFQAYQAAIKLADQQDSATPPANPSDCTKASHQTGKQRPRRQGPRPRCSKKLADYSYQDFEAFLQWIESDGLRRTKNDLLEAIKQELSKQWASTHERRCVEAIQRFRSPQESRSLRINPRWCKLNRVFD